MHKARCTARGIGVPASLLPAWSECETLCVSQPCCWWYDPVIECDLRNTRNSGPPNRGNSDPSRRVKTPHHLFVSDVAVRPAKA